MNNIRCTKCGKPLYDDHKSTGIPDLCTCTPNFEKGSTRECGHFVDSLLSFCPVCREIKEIKEKLINLRYENKELTSIKKEEVLKYIKKDIDLKIKKKLSLLTIDRLVQIMTDEECRVVPEGRDVTRVELATVIFKVLKEVANEQNS